MVVVGAQSCGVKYVLRGPQSGISTRATIHAQLRLIIRPPVDSPEGVKGRVLMMSSPSVVDYPLGFWLGLKVAGLSMSFWAREAGPSHEIRHTRICDLLSVPLLSPLRGCRSGALIMKSPPTVEPPPRALGCRVHRIDGSSGPGTLDPPDCDAASFWHCSPE